MDQIDYPSDFSTRLRRCVSAADMTVADVTRWFDRPRATIDTWIAGRTPWGPAGREAAHDLQRLEFVIDQHNFRIPSGLRRQQRIDFVLEWRDAVRKYRVSEAHPSA